MNKKIADPFTGGIAPGATYMIPKGTESVVRYINRGNKSSAVHLHGSYTHAPWDGWAYDEIEVGQYKDYYYPNTESARSMWYHDHAHGHTAEDAYYGQSGAYYLTDSEDEDLGIPVGKYQLPLAIMDKTYQANGDLASPDHDPNGFFGDTIEVNNQPWPYFRAEPRKYHLRFFNMALSRVFDIYAVDEENNPIEFQMIASDSGLFESPVSAKDFSLSPGERYEIVIDFSSFAGKNVTIMDSQRAQPENTKFANTDKVMRFVVGDVVTDNNNNGKVPTHLANVNWPPSRDTIDHEFNFQLGGAARWTINGVDFADPNSRVLARPPQGTVERWRLRHTGGPAPHPVHVHLVNLQVISRTGSARGLAPYETAGLKDVVLLLPGETVDVLAMYGPWNGMYMFHCHNLIHEDDYMMAAFNTTRLQELGYEYNSTMGFADPMDSRFRAKDYDVSAFTDEARREKVRKFGELNAYKPAQRLQAAENAYYATAGYKGDVDPPKPAKTAAPESSGLGFLTGVQPTQTALFSKRSLETPSPAKGSRRGSAWRA
jgi:FtsP/CotA-like multicopper oxidase with cupredoxin domain